MFKKRNIRDRVISAGIVIVVVAFVILFVYRVDAKIPAGGYEYRVLEKHVTMGTIYDRKGEYIAKGVDEDTEKYNPKYEVSMSNLIGASIEDTYADVYTVRGKYASILYGRNMNLLLEINPFHQRTGEDVYLTVDGQTQNYIYKILKKYECASVLVLNWKTGDIIAAVSTPVYNLSTDSEELEREENGLVISDKAYNKNFKDSEPCGSIVKCIVDACALEIDDKFKDYEYDCNPETHKFNGIKVECYKGTYHGKLGMKKALAVSCNGYQLALINQMNEDELAQKLQKFGFDTTVTLPGSLSFYDSRYFGNREKADQDSKTLAGIGQGNAKASPVSIAYAYSALFNGGESVPIHIVSSPSAEKKETETVCSKETADTIIEYMRSVTEDGTGKTIKNLKYRCASKTGTAEITNKYNTLWFVGGSVEEKSPYMTVVCLQYCPKGMKASKDAGAVANKVLEYVFENTDRY